MISLSMAKISLKIPGREQLEFDYEIDAAGALTSSRMTGVGNYSFLVYIHGYRKNLNGKLADLPLPSGHSTAELMIAEAVLKARGEWKPTFTDEEVCHCRNVPLAVVDAAVVCGAHTPEKVSSWTSASTACGTCRPDVETHLRFRLRSGN
jgi:bacterioferritin-associated ferredoxin